MSDPEFDAFHADGGRHPRLILVCTDGTTVGCPNFTATEGGVLLTDDLERERAFGFVPNGECSSSCRRGPRTGSAAGRRTAGGSKTP